jgi:hypothetical protein
MELIEFNVWSKDLESVAHFLVSDGEYRFFATIGEDHTFQLSVEKKNDSYVVIDYFTFWCNRKYVPKSYDLGNSYELGQALTLNEVESLYFEIKKIADDIDAGVYDEDFAYEGRFYPCELFS